MTYVGQMVRAGGSAPMKVIDISEGVAKCIWIDGNGVIRHRSHGVAQLTPVWMSLGPKSVWPDMAQIDLIEIEREQRAARNDRQQIRRTLARKARKSKRLQRKVGE